MRWKALAIKILVYGTFAVTLIAVLFLIGYRVRHPIARETAPSNYQQKSETKAANTQQAYTEPYREKAQSNDSYAAQLTEPMTILTAFLVLGVFATNWIYYKQLKKMEAAVNFAGKQTETAQGQLAAMQGQLETMNAQRELLQRDIESTEKSSIYAQRAYVTAKIRRVTDVTKRLDTFLMILRIENSGNTPANDLVVMYGCGLKEKPPCEKTPDGLVVCDSGGPYVTRLGVVAPNDSYQVIYTPRIGFESIEDFKAFECGKLAFYCWGRITYEDIFNKPRHSDFCFFQSWERPDGYPCEYGNEVF